MLTSIKDDLCHGLRASGIPKKQAYQILNVVTKWCDSSGVQWTNQRVKDLRQWYETCLAGKPSPPVWFRHSKSGYPLGIWKWVFELPVAKALAVLSLNTVFQVRDHEDPLPTQLEKFNKGVAGNGTPSKAKLMELWEAAGSPKNLPRKLPDKMPEIPLPTLFDMNDSVPFNQGQSALRPEGRLGKALQAEILSWKDIPSCTFEFLGQQALLGYAPLHVLGNEYALELSRDRTDVIGRLGYKQEPELKLRVFANPNRVTQVTLDPLKTVWFGAARSLPSDCTYNQEKGVEWCQEQLKLGHSVAGSDLTSASDLLDLDLSVDLVTTVFGFDRIQGYEDHVAYFKEACRSRWYMSGNFGVPAHYVQWSQGYPLGLGPTFGLLTLTNNCAALLAASIAESEGNAIDHRLWNNFRVVGDDIVMRAEMSPYYQKVIEALGGEINHSKTLTSDLVAEFAGRIVLPEASHMKRIKYCDPSDDSFMSYMASLGRQAQFFLKPRQRRAWNFFKEVPGIAVDGPWMRDSYGEPLDLRYQWYLEEVLPAMRREEPDQRLIALDAAYLAAKLDAEVAGRHVDPRDYGPVHAEDFQSSVVTNSFRSGKDPRRPRGASLEQVLNRLIEQGSIRPYADWKQDLSGSRLRFSSEWISPPSEPYGGRSRRKDGLPDR